MPACGYEFYLRVFNSTSHEWAALTREISSWTLEDTVTFISTRWHAISSIYYTLVEFWPYTFYTRYEGSFKIRTSSELYNSVLPHLSLALTSLPCQRSPRINTGDPWSRAYDELCNPRLYILQFGLNNSPSIISYAILDVIYYSSVYITVHLSLALISLPYQKNPRSNTCDPWSGAYDELCNPRRHISQFGLYIGSSIISHNLLVLLENPTP